MTSDGGRQGNSGQKDMPMTRAISLMDDREFCR